MSQMDLLWLYQQEDMKAEQLSQEMRKNPNRVKLEKDRDFILTQQKNYQAIEEELAQMADRMDMILSALPRCEEQLKSLASRLEADQPEDAETVAALLAEATTLRKTIADYESEIRRIAKESSSQASKQVNIRHQAASTKQEFTRLKEIYDKELAEQKAALDAQKALVKSKAEGVDEALLNRYLSIKKHVYPPVAKLYGDQCGGCNTSLPSAFLQKMRASGDVVECETCGRMLYVQG